MSNREKVEGFAAELKEQAYGAECLGGLEVDVSVRNNHEEVQMKGRELYDCDLEALQFLAKKHGLNLKIESMTSEGKNWEDSAFLVIAYP